MIFSSAFHLTEIHLSNISETRQTGFLGLLQAKLNFLRFRDHRVSKSPEPVDSLFTLTAAGGSRPGWSQKACFNECFRASACCRSEVGCCRLRCISLAWYFFIFFKRHIQGTLRGPVMFARKRDVLFSESSYAGLPLNVMPALRHLRGIVSHSITWNWLKYFRCFEMVWSYGYINITS